MANPAASFNVIASLQPVCFTALRLAHRTLRFRCEQVTFEDQQMMNEFGRLQDQLEELQVDIADLQVRAITFRVVFCLSLRLCVVAWCRTKWSGSRMRLLSS